MPDAPTISTALTIGNFDGVHIGHAALMRRARDLVGPAGQVIVLTFDPHPSSLLRPQSVPSRLTSFETRGELLKFLGADAVERLEPTREFLEQSPRQFIELLVAKYQPEVIVEGPDFCFGKARAGNISLLRQLGATLSFAVDEVPGIEVDLDDQTIVPASSTRARWLIERGRVSDAARVLGRPYQIRGTVVQGDRRGRTIGIPTANISTDQLLPADGVYGGRAILDDGRAFIAAISVGSRPTFNGASRRMEVHLLHTPPNGHRIAGVPEYGWNLRIDISHWIREDLKFPGIDPLIAQIRRDCARIEQVCPRIPIEST